MTNQHAALAAPAPQNAVPQAALPAGPVPASGTRGERGLVAAFVLALVAAALALWWRYGSAMFVDLASAAFALCF